MNYYVLVIWISNSSYSPAFKYQDKGGNVPSFTE